MTVGEGATEAIHIPIGDWMVTVSGIIAALTTVLLVVVSVRLIQATKQATEATEHVAMLANEDMRLVSEHANTEMKHVAVASIAASANQDDESH